jgi:flagellar hook-associated protein 3 FlgL
MRVTDSFRFQTYTATLSTLESQMDTLTNQIASGKKVLVPSDGPASYAQNMQITAEQSQNTQYASNLNSLQANGAYYQTSLNSMGNILTTVQQLAVQMSSSTVDASARSAAADQVDGYIQQLTALGNTKVGDTYIFGGEKANGAAYTLDSTTNSVTFNGTDNVAKVAVSSSTTVDAGISGNTIFNGTVNGQNVDIFATLQQFGNDLANNDTAALQTDSTNINNCTDLTANSLAYVGTYTQNISSLLATNTTTGTTLTQTSDNLVDVNTAQAYSDYTTLSTAYQAALYVMSKAESLSILNYLPAG